MGWESIIDKKENGQDLKALLKKLERKPGIKVYRCNTKTDDDNKGIKILGSPKLDPTAGPGFHKIGNNITINVIVTHVVNPHEFYVRYVRVKEKESKTGTLLYCRMQEFYNDPINANDYRLRTGQLFPNRRYVCKVNQKSFKTSWEICVVSCVDLARRICTVTIPNIGTKIQYVPFDNIYELYPGFQEFHDRQIQCSLVDVKSPIFPKKWPVESIEGFKKLVLWREFYCHISSFKNDTKDGLPIFKTNVALLGKNSDSTINTQLCYNGLAASSGPSSVRRCVDLRSKLIISAEKPARSTRLDTSGKIENCPPFYEDWLNDKEFLKEFLSQVPKKKQSKLGMYYMTSFLTPSCFYAIEFDKLPAFHKMMTELSIQLANCPDDHEYTEMSSGDFVGIRYKYKESFMYYRAVIKEIVSYEKIKLLLIDFGCSFETLGADFKLLPLDFLNVPSFSKRFHLNLKPSRNSKGFPSKAIDLCTAFNRQKQEEKSSLTHFFNSKKPKLENTADGVIKLEEFNQKIYYDHTKNKWEVGRTLDLNGQKNFNNLGKHQHPLLKNLFQSVEIEDIVYQDKSSYEVTKMTSLLKDAGYA